MKKKPAHKQLRDRLFYHAIVALITVLRLLPRKSALALMKLLGTAVFHLAQKERRKIIRHLEFAFGKEKTGREIQAIAKGVAVHFFTVLADFFRLPVIIRQGINSFTTVEGIHHLDEAMKAGRGVIMITGHFGNWELLGAWLAQNGYPLKVVGTALFDPRLDALLVDARNQAGYTNIARGKGTREIVRALKQGDLVGMLIDQDTEVQGVFVNFFNRPAYTPIGPVVLARKYNLTIIPIFMHLKDDLSYHIVCHAPLPLECTDNEDQDHLINTQRCSDAIEQAIRQHPEQWAWMHKRWHKQPVDNEAGYVII